MRYLLAFLITAGLALPASAQNWTNLVSGVVSNSLSPGDVAFFNYTTALTDSNHLTVTACSTITYAFEPDLTGGAALATSYLLGCSTSDANADGTADITACDEMLNDTDGSGTPNLLPMNGDSTVNRRGDTRMAPFSVVADPQVLPGAGDTARWTVKCNGPGGV